MIIDKSSDISVAILAGGVASRWGGIQKASIHFLGKPLISQYIELLAPLTGELLVIANSPLVPLPESVCVYPDIIPGKGPLSGFHAALSHACNPQVLLLACDMPLITKELLLLIMDKSRQHPGKAIVPRHHMGYEPLLTIWPKTLLATLNQWLIEGKSSKIIRFLEAKEAMEVVDVTPYHHLFSNINTPDDLERINHLIQDRSK